VARGHVEAALAAALAADWAIVRGWAAPLGRERVVCTGWVRTPDDARRALLAAVSGAGLIVGCSVDRDTVDRFLDDLHRLGPVEHLHATGPPATPSLNTVERALVGLVAEGLTIREAATELGVPRRTADRRLASARARLGVGSNAAAVVAALARGR
jgi:DNA-binding NarL/FixJ family response regulator